MTANADDRLAIDTQTLIKRRLSSIDILRGLAVLAVILVHIPHEAPGGWRQNGWLIPSQLMNFGYLGVPLFVLISGFCIHRRAAISRAQSGHWRLNWKGFWRRRFWRLYPPYVAAIAVSVLLDLGVHHRHPQLASGLAWDLSTHLLMVHNLTRQYAAGLGNPAFWSLGMEEQLYALYVLLLIGLRRRWPIVLAITAVTMGWRLLVPVLGDVSIGTRWLEIGSWYLWPLSYWLHWTLGALAVDAYFGNRRLPKWTQSIRWAAGCMVIGMISNNVTFRFLQSTAFMNFELAPRWTAALPWLHTLGELIIAVGFFCLLRWFLTRENSFTHSWHSVSGILSGIGKASYSIYLVHLPVIYTLDHFVSLGGVGSQWLWRCLLHLSGSLVAGAVFYLTVEQWFLSGHPPGYSVRSSGAAAAEGS